MSEAVLIAVILAVPPTLAVLVGWRTAKRELGAKLDIIHAQGKEIHDALLTVKKRNAEIAQLHLLIKALTTPTTTTGSTKQTRTPR